MREIHVTCRLSETLLEHDVCYRFLVYCFFFFLFTCDFELRKKNPLSKW